MKKLALAVCVLGVMLHNKNVPFDLNWLVQFKDYGMALLIALAIQPWVANQFDS